MDDVGRDQLKAAANLGDRGGGEFDPCAKVVVGHVLPGHGHRVRVVVHSHHLRAAEQGRGHGEYAGAGADVERAGAGVLLEARRDQPKRHPGGGMLAGAEGHARVHLVDPLAGRRGVGFPGGLDHQAGHDGKRLEVLLPAGGPVLVGEQGVGGAHRFLAVQGEQFRHARLDQAHHRLGLFRRVGIALVAQFEKAAHRGALGGGRTLLDAAAAEHGEQVAGRLEQHRGAGKGDFQPLPAGAGGRGCHGKPPGRGKGWPCAARTGRPRRAQHTQNRAGGRAFPPRPATAAVPTVSGNLPIDKRAVMRLLGSLFGSRPGPARSVRRAPPLFRTTA